MKINEVSERLHITKRAIKYYEEKGFLHIKKDESGYRDYHEEDILRLQRVILYRKLGIGIQDIEHLLKNPKDVTTRLELIYRQKQQELEGNQAQLTALKDWIDTGGSNEQLAKTANMMDYTTIANALQDMIPGVIGQTFMYHFIPYLQIPMITDEQREAYEIILNFWDNFHIKIPLVMRINSFIQKIMHVDMQLTTAKIDQNIQSLLYPTPQEYEKTKQMIARNVKVRNSIMFKYNPFMIAHRKFMMRLQDSGYNDIFIPNMIKLSPKYKEYHDALTAMNDRVCKDLGLYYDAHYQLIMKK